MMKFPLLYFATPAAAYATYCLTFNSSPPNSIPTQCQGSAIPSTPSQKDLKLSQIQVITRHGARTPTYWTEERFRQFSNLTPQIWDSNTLSKPLEEAQRVRYEVRLPDGSHPQGAMYDSSAIVRLRGGCMSGELTHTGKKQHWDLGRKLARLYMEEQPLLSTVYDPEEVWVRSSYYERTVLSAVSLISGLYSNGTIDQVVRLETKEQAREDIFANGVGCANFFKWSAYMFSGEARTPAEAEAENHINSLLGKKDGVSNTTLYHINDMLRCRTAHGVAVPQYLIDEAEVINKHELSMMSKLLGKGSVEVVRLCSGSLLQTLMSTIEDKINDETSHKMLLYSAHDWTILSVLLAFGVDVKVWPGFASHIIIELYEVASGEGEGEHYVRVFYNDDVLVLDGETGTDVVPVDQFRELLRRYQVVDWDDVCGNCSQGTISLEQEN